MLEMNSNIAAAKAAAVVYANFEGCNVLVHD